MIDAEMVVTRAARLSQARGKVLGLCSTGLAAAGGKGSQRSRRGSRWSKRVTRIAARRSFENPACEPDDMQLSGLRARYRDTAPETSPVGQSDGP